MLGRTSQPHKSVVTCIAFSVVRIGSRSTPISGPANTSLGKHGDGLREAHSGSLTDRADDLPPAVDEEQEQDVDLDRADGSGWELDRQPPQGGDERRQSAVMPGVYCSLGTGRRRALPGVG